MQKYAEWIVNGGIDDDKINDGGIDDGFIILTANDKPMKTIADLQEAVKEASLSKNPVLFITGIWPSGKTDYKAIKVGE